MTAHVPAYASTFGFAVPSALTAFVHFCPNVLGQHNAPPEGGRNYGQAGDPSGIPKGGREDRHRQEPTARDDNQPTYRKETLMAKTKDVNIRRTTTLDATLHTKLSHVAVDKHVSLRELLDEAVREWLKKASR